MLREAFRSVQGRNMAMSLMILTLPSNKDIREDMLDTYTLYHICAQIERYGSTRYSARLLQSS